MNQLPLEPKKPRPPPKPLTTLMVQAPLPDFLDTLPILISITGGGSRRQGLSPAAPLGRPANDN